MPGPRPVRLFSRLLVADRGVMAARIARTCDALGITPVFAVSEADREAPYVRGRERVCVGPADARRSYRDAKALLQAAKQTRCQALHPGSGPLADSAAFAALCVTHGVTFVGPPAHVIARAREGAFDPRPSMHGRAPVLADAPGDDRFGSARRLAVQVLADRYGHVVHLGERDRTAGLGARAVIVESPAPTLGEPRRRRLWMAAVAAARASGLVGVGTVEMLAGVAGAFRITGIVPHLEPDHGVTEVLTGVDLVREQILVAAGHALGLAPRDVTPRGHAVACHVHAEDLREGVIARPGPIDPWQIPDVSDGDLRVDTHVERGYRLPHQYDRLLCELVARGSTREAARDRLLLALEQLRCDGVPTTVPLHAAVLASGRWLRNDHDATTVHRWLPLTEAFSNGTHPAATHRRSA